MDQYEMEVVERQPQLALVIEFECQLELMPTEMPAQISLVYKFAKEHGAEINGQPFVRHSTLNSKLRTFHAGVPIRVAIPGTDSIKTISLPGGQVATTIHVGPHEMLEVAHRTLHSWVRDNDYQLVGGPWEVYLSDPMLEPDTSQFKTELFQAVKK